MRIFGWVSEKEFEESIDLVREACDKNYNALVERRYKDQLDYTQEISNLRGQITDLQNKLKIAEGKAVAEAHAKGEPAPKHVPFPRPKAKRPKVVKP